VQAFNGVHYKNQIYNPLFAQIQAGETIDPKIVASATFDGIGGGDLIVSLLSHCLTLEKADTSDQQP